MHARALIPGERDVAARTLAASFDDDPLFRWMLPDGRDRRAWIEWFHGVSVDAAHPKGPVVYVHVLGVHPAQKGKGLGGVLLREALAMAAREGAPLFLETSNPVNLGFYRRFGLGVQRELRVADAPPLWTLQTDEPPRA